MKAQTPAMEQKGFTLIELVIVIVILGILAATALPKFVDLKGDAAQAAVSGAAGALMSSANINYGKYQINSSQAQRLTTTGSCATLAAAASTGLVGGLGGAHAAVSSDASCASSTSGATANCTLNSTDDTSKTASATIICTG